MNTIKPLTRRSALGLLAATGGATLLAACGAQPQAPSGSSSVAGSASASAAASKTARTDYSGVATLDGYTSKPSDYQPATRTEPSKNAPVPVKPAVANENSVEGLYQSIAFFGAAHPRGGCLQLGYSSDHRHRRVHREQGPCGRSLLRFGP